MMPYWISPFLLFFISCMASCVAKTPTPPAPKENIITVALWDTTICPLALDKKQVDIAPILDFSDDAPSSREQDQCAQTDQQFVRALHGHYMLQTLLKQLPAGTTKIRLVPYKIFSRHGNSAGHFWQRALNWAKDHPSHLHLMGVGLPMKREQWDSDWSQRALPSGIVIAAAATFGAGIDHHSYVWPQDLKRQNSNSPMLWLVAGATQDNIDRANMPPQMASKGHFDPTTLRTAMVDWAVQFPQGNKIFAGNSWAAARAANFVLTEFMKAQEYNNINNLELMNGSINGRINGLPKIEIGTITTSKKYPFLVFP
jgi:hypothetical protein